MRKREHYNVYVTGEQKKKNDNKLIYRVHNMLATRSLGIFLEKLHASRRRANRRMCAPPRAVVVPEHFSEKYCRNRRGSNVLIFSYHKFYIFNVRARLSSPSLSQTELIVQKENPRRYFSWETTGIR